MRVIIIFFLKRANLNQQISMENPWFSKVK